MKNNLQIALSLLLGSLLALLGLMVHAQVRRQSAPKPDPALALAPWLPAADLAVTGAARHLRFLSLEEPNAAFSDLPASLDLDPADGLIAPPVELWRASDPGKH
jgi:hypothetical protein